MRFEIKNQSGMVLILSVLIISSVLLTATVFGNLIIREILQSRLIDQSIQAYYLAESGAERALYQTRIAESVTDCAAIGAGSCQENNSHCTSKSEIPCITATPGSLAGLAGDWQINVSQEAETNFILQEGETFQMDLFSPQQVRDADIAGIEVGSQTSVGLYGELTNLTNILKVGDENCDDQPPVFKGIITAPQRLSGLDGKNILGSCSYIFRLRYPLNNSEPTDLITLKVYNDSGELVDIPSRLIIASAASFGNSQQTVTVRTPIRPPLSGLYDFVLFSEKEIVK